MEYRVSVLQYQPLLLQTRENLERLESMLRDLESDLVVAPELALSGYVFSSPDEVNQVAEEIPSGYCFQHLRDLAMRRNFSLVYGFAETSEGLFYNSAVQINPDETHHVYRKIHLFNREKLFFTPGDKPFAMTEGKNGVKLGMMICFDWQFPESSRSLALQGAQIICHPSNLVLPWCQQSMITRSLENRVFSITSNRIGTEKNGELEEYFTGQSQILGTKGEVLLRMGDEECGIRTCIIDPDQALDKSTTPRNEVFKDRRPELYTL
ncbi:MAG: nitrilase-related carbon-nitrogen hydrolase [Candidatus Cloacimonadaceae bacterium]|nr:nitrilase-related carbon-nitrogen hydrolase [Candidatus Cloacimonadaceae bacterium]